MIEGWIYTGSILGWMMCMYYSCAWILKDCGRNNTDDMPIAIIIAEAEEI